ncbi:MAG: LysM peptidoglycan-binding domain-containing protein [Rhizobiaceae bacterium]|nr:LysM peptidoglycan-binding domain-containing protein [Rhizobiaceae bacterium]
MTEQPAATAEQEATPPPSTAENDKPQDTQIAAVDPNTPAAEAKPEATPPAVTEPQPAAPVAEPSLPTFDLLRVEADGSMVIAGKAVPEARIELLTNDKVIGAGTAGNTGDFVVVLDTPLTPGDYQITIRATGKDNAVLTSAQTAIVSIPKDANGQVLAMIEEPGKPSEIITVPQPDPAKPAEVAAADQPKPAEQPAVNEGDAAAEAGTPEETAQPAPSAEQPKPAETDVAAAQPQPQPEAPAASPPPALPAIDVAVEAVEIEGNKVFVAGRAPVGSIVRVYANEIFLGENKTSAAGRFLVEAIRDLPVGSYIVRADVMASDGKVLARAAVPFEREEGENIAAVASQPGTEEGASKPVETAAGEPTPEASAPAAEPSAPAASAETQPPASTADKPATTAEAAAPPANQTPAADEPAIASDQPAASEQPTVAVSAPPAAGNPPAEQQPATTAAEADNQTPAAEDQKPAEIAAVTPPAEITAPPLQNVNSAVIIRRGDTLWRISKRVYGRGVRYSTIYLANQDQIRDPDMIWPGQVFGVPDRTEEGEAADMSKMGEQATTKAQ